MSAYKLSQAQAHLAGLPWLTVAVDRGELEGMYDGVNKTFRAPAAPMLATPVITAASGSAPEIDTASLDSGVIVFKTAPTMLLYATYRTGPLTSEQLAWIVRKGFDEMQSRYRRDYYLVEDAAPSTDASISSAATPATDPITGGRTFSTSRVQLDFFHTCCEYILVKLMAQGATVTAMDYREERVGGLAVSTFRQPGDWREMLTVIAAELAEKEFSARDECGDKDMFGYFLPGPGLDGQPQEWQ